MFPFAALSALATLAAVVSGQQVGTSQAETHPKLTTSKCTTAGGCVTQQSSIVIDANWRWLHNVGGYTNCYTGNTWNNALCPDGATCAANCALEGADYSGTYGITTSGDALSLKFVTGANIGSRVYLLDETDSAYQLLKLKNQEFTFDVDVSNLPCGLNGALYFSQMDADGGLAKYPTNKAGAKYGTGYCDAQCPHDVKFINGEANSESWTPSSNDKNAGSGKYGSCCTEMDIWEANKVSAAYTPHPCSVDGQTRCTGTDCGDDASNERYDGVCDKDGCDFNSYRMGNTSFYGQGMPVDTATKFTVVTQFITDDGTASGDLSEIKRFYVQNGKVIANSLSTVSGVSGNSITDGFCSAQKTAFGDTNTFSSKGGLKKVGDALEAGMVLVMSLWDDHAANMLWLDSEYPLTKSATTAGVARGTCATTSGVPSDVEGSVPNSSVTYSNIRFGDIDSTYSGTAAPGPVTSSKPSSTSSVKPSTATSVKPTTTSAQPVTTTSAKPITTTSAKPITTTSAKPITTSSTAQPTTTAKPNTTTSSSAPAGTAVAAHWAQCGGQGYTGPTVCASGTTCQVQNPWYSQCL